MYALNVDKNTGRVLSATYEKYGAPESPIVDFLPDGNIYDYLYVDGYYVFDPLPEPEMPKPEPTPEERFAALEKAGLERDMALIELAAMLAGGGL
jgi:hypothetical protein